MPTRHKKDRPTHFPIRVDSAAGSRQVQIAAADYPRVYGVFRLAPPGILEGREPIDTNPEGTKVEFQGHHEDVEALFEKGYATRGVDTVALGHTLQWGPFNRFLAKIAHAYAVAQFGRNGYEHLLPPLILGRSAHFSHYVGGFEDASPVRYPLLLELHPVGSEYFITCKIWLLWPVDPFHWPTYHVVVGRTLDPQQWIARAASIKAAEEAATNT